ncbi:MAG: enoyl-CoA hydratase/isomerase family protein [Proteobacteria bacterium]|nr:enoyl-CoA hydratase/isomerase family protein [Pseudomonadota bacterium]
MSLWTTEVEAGIVIATYLNPPMNYIGGAGAAELGELICAWHEPAVRAVILTGGMPGRFITHFSVDELLALASDPKELVRVAPELSRNYHALLMSLRNLPKPVIVAMNGDTMGGGFELCLAADIRILARGNHRVGLPEVRFGIIPGGAGTQNLTRLIGLARATEFILRGRVADPETALELGLVHELADDARARALTIARDLAGMAPVALASAKRAIYAGFDLPLADALSLEADLFMDTMLAGEGTATFKRYNDLPYEKRRGWIDCAGTAYIGNSAGLQSMTNKVTSAFRGKS